jgi:hypothetical protein
MVKNILSYIFIYILLVGCNIQNPVYAGECDGYELEITAPSLEQSLFGQYTMEWIDGYVQTFTTLAAETGAGPGHHIYFESNKALEYPPNSGNYVESINHHSYTRRDGTTNAVFCAWEFMVGDVATVTATWSDECGNVHTDDIKIVIVNRVDEYNNYSNRRTNELMLQGRGR